jgi:hypothetical protein
MRRHEIPTHLDVQDRILGPLTTRDALCLLSGAAAAYALGTEPSIVPEARLVGAGAIAAGSTVLALARVDDRPLDEWLFALFAYLVAPRRARWRSLDGNHPTETSGVAGWRTRRLAPAWVSSVEAIQEGERDATSERRSTCERRPAR